MPEDLIDPTGSSHDVQEASNNAQIPSNRDQKSPLDKMPDSNEDEENSGMKAEEFRGGVLVKDEIETLGLIKLPDDEHEDCRCYKHASYDLRLGRDYVMPRVLNNNNQLEVLSCEENGILEIQPFASVIISSYESVSLPNYVCGRFDLRIKHALEGLIVQMGTQVEPGYTGQLFALLHNVSQERKRLKFKDYETRPFTVEFFYTSKPTSPPQSQKKTIKDFIPVNYATGGLDHVLKKMEEVQKEIKDVSTDFNAKKIVFTTSVIAVVLISLISSIIPFMLSKFTYDKDDFPIANTKMIVDIQSASKKAKEEAEIIDQVLQKIVERYPILLDKNKGPQDPKAENLGNHSKPEYYYLNRIILLKERRESLLKGPLRDDEINSIDNEINSLMKKIKE